MNLNAVSNPLLLGAINFLEESGVKVTSSSNVLLIGTIESQSGITLTIYLHNDGVVALTWQMGPVKEVLLAGVLVETVSELQWLLSHNVVIISNFPQWYRQLTEYY